MVSLLHCKVVRAGEMVDSLLLLVMGMELVSTSP